MAVTIAGIAALIFAAILMFATERQRRRDQKRLKEEAQSPFDEVSLPGADVVVSSSVPTTLSVYDLVVGYGSPTETSKVNVILSNQSITTPFRRPKERARQRA